MTNENIVGGTAVVNPSSTSSGHNLRSASNVQVEHGEHFEEAALIREEEKMMVDEEITSVESGGDHATHDGSEAHLEQSMLSAAIMESVVETKAEPYGDGCNDDVSNDQKHYGLRKRRRRSGHDLERLEHFQSSTDGGLARVKKEIDDDTCGLEFPSENLQLPPEPQLHPGHPAASAPDPVTSHLAQPHTESSPPIASSSSVPNPLSHPLPPNSTMLSGTEDNPSTTNVNGLSAVVPCPLPAAVFEPEAVPEVHIVANHVADDKLKKVVNFTEPTGTRMRGFSIDMDIGLEFPDDGSASGGGRDRAFSFECFAFGINADEPLPPLEQSTSNQQVSRPARPRGDSIIFDPSSFQEGGIHEQSALERARSASVEIPTVLPATVSSHPNSSAAAVPSSVTSVAQTAVANTPCASANYSIQYQSSSTSEGLANVTACSAAGGTTVSMDLLNKDGRIGIYLPEARRARIARFHAKRAKRIWRKRIKYDCRKKLADSRPRIKGRFVKRSDMDD